MPKLTLPEAAEFLQLGEKTVLRLTSQSELPGQLEEGKWSFDKKDLKAWLKSQVSEEELTLVEAAQAGAHVPLTDLLPAGAALDLRATTGVGIIEELAGKAYANGWLNDKPWFVGAVVERESLASTAMEGGVAFLHTRQRHEKKVGRPFIIAGRSYEGVNFGAPDGKPTYLFFLLGLKYDRLHLPILGRLARVLRNPATIAKARSLPNAEKMRALLIKEDSSALATSDMNIEFKSTTKIDHSMRLRKIREVIAEKNAPPKRKRKTTK